MANPAGDMSLSERNNPQVRAHPEFAAGGYAQDDGTVEFYQRVVSVLPEGGIVLDFGAGRGAMFDGKEANWSNCLVRLGKKYSRRIGVDVDPAVLTNPELEEAKVIEAREAAPVSRSNLRSRSLRLGYRTCRRSGIIRRGSAPRP